MLNLILETSSEKGLIILAKKERVLTSLPLTGGKELSQALAFKVHELLGEEKPSLVAVGKGPGSYTGIRVGYALAQSLAYGWGVPLLGFCSLKAFEKSPLLVDARSLGFYALLEKSPERLSGDDPKLFSLKKVFSPHPDAIAQRLNIPVFPAEMDPAFLAQLVQKQFETEGALPFDLYYGA